MKHLLLLLLFPALAIAEFRLTAVSNPDGKGPRFVLEDSQSKARADWIELGSPFQGYTLSAFDPKSGILTLTKGSESMKVGLVDAAVQHAPAASPAPVPPAARTVSASSLAQLSDDELKARGLNRLKPGDTMAKIAREHGLTVQQLVALNPGVEPAKLRVGQILKVRPE